MWDRVRVTDAGIASVSTADAKAHLRVDFTDDDTLIDAYVSAATRYVEQQTGTALRQQTWELTLDEFCGDIRLPGWPVQSVTSIGYVDADGASQTVLPADYIVTVEKEPAVIEAPNGWPGTDIRHGAVTVTYVVGATAEPDLLQAVRMTFAHWYEHRESVGQSMSETPFGVQEIINMHRRGFAAV